MKMENDIFFILPSKTEINKNGKAEFRKSRRINQNYKSELELIIDNYNNGKYSLDEFIKLKTILARTDLFLLKYLKPHLIEILTTDNKELELITEQVINTNETRINQKQFTTPDIISIFTEIFLIYKSSLQSDLLIDKFSTDDLKLILEDQDLYNKNLEMALQSFEIKTIRLSKIEIIKEYIQELKNDINLNLEEVIKTRIQKEEYKNEKNVRSDYISHKKEQSIKVYKRMNRR